MMRQGRYSQPLAFLLKGGKIKCPEKLKERGTRSLNLLLESIIGVNVVEELMVISGNLGYAEFVLENWR